MFGFFKKKLKDVVSKFSKKVEKEAKEESLLEKASGKEENVVEEEEKLEGKPRKEIKEKKPKKKKEKRKIEEQKKEIKPILEKKAREEIDKEKIEEEKKELKKEIKEKKSLFKKLKEKVTTRKISENKFEDLFSDLELVLLENNVALEVVDKIKQSLKLDLVNVPIGNVNKIVEKSLKENLDEILDFKKINLIEKIKNKKPFVIMFLGVNGTGKTLSIAKLANLFMKNDLECILVAADTFRAASIEQLEEHARKLSIKVIKHKYGSDPAAVSYDGVKHAEAKGIDVVLIDTAGRQHSNQNLIDELKKVNRIAKPDFRIFVGESITGNDCIEQAKSFNDAIGIDGVILTKADVDDKGGTAISISFVIEKPILYFGTGQNYSDLEEFDKKEVLESLGF